MENSQERYQSSWRRNEGEETEELIKVVYWNPPLRCERCIAFGHWSKQCKSLNKDGELKDKETNELDKVGEVGSNENEAHVVIGDGMHAMVSVVETDKEEVGSRERWVWYFRRSIEEING